jgi:hypothetical protein
MPLLLPLPPPLLLMARGHPGGGQAQCLSVQYVIVCQIRFHLSLFINQVTPNIGRSNWGAFSFSQK